MSGLIPRVCGIDLGGARTASYVAWLDGARLRFDVYRATPACPLPPAPDGRPVAAYALDGPQGLPDDPGDGRRSARAADRAAHTPTQSLPTTADGLRDLRLYGPFVRNAVALFWQLHSGGTVRLFGLADALHAAPGLPVACEAWPRRVLQRLVGDGVALPSKRREPEAYVRLVWQRLRALGLDAPGVLAPSVDQADAALCALAARAAAAWAVGPDRAAAGFERLGRPPRPDPAAGFVREGYIVAP